MTEKIFLVSILIFFILAFFIKNLKTHFASKVSVRGNSPKVTASILLSSAIYFVLFLRLTIFDPETILEFNTKEMPWVSIAGYAFVLAGFLFGMLALIAMKNSWRVGIRYDQKTELIQTGIYRFSRNPYFLSYDILIFGCILIFPSWILLALYLPLVFIFHAMIKEEEAYLQNVHGKDYADFRIRVGRYFTFKLSANRNRTPSPFR